MRDHQKTYRWMPLPLGWLLRVLKMLTDVLCLHLERPQFKRHSVGL